MKYLNIIWSWFYSKPKQTDLKYWIENTVIKNEPKQLSYPNAGTYHPNKDYKQSWARQ